MQAPTRTRTDTLSQYKALILNLDSSETPHSYTHTVFDPLREHLLLSPVPFKPPLPVAVAATAGLCAGGGSVSARPLGNEREQGRRVGKALEETVGVEPHRIREAERDLGQRRRTRVSGLGARNSDAGGKGKSEAHTER